MSLRPDDKINHFNKVSMYLAQSTDIFHIEMFFFCFRICELKLECSVGYFVRGHYNTDLNCWLLLLTINTSLSSGNLNQMNNKTEERLQTNPIWTTCEERKQRRENEPLPPPLYSLRLSIFKQAELKKLGSLFHSLFGMEFIMATEYLCFVAKHVKNLAFPVKL